MKIFCWPGASDVGLIRLDLAKFRRLSLREIQLATVGILSL
jgi:hypothetical protein